MFEVLPGFRDFYPDACRKRNFLFQRCRDWARRFDFSEYDIPTLEPLELFTRKSGEEIVEQLFHFEDKGGRAVALRPELTPSLARMVGSRINSLKRPVKWFNIAENFRYERQQKGRLRSHYQFNADIFGEPGPGADAEIISLLLHLLQDLGLGPDAIRLRLSDRRLWMLFLEGLGLEGDRALQVLAVIDKMERLSEEALRDQLQPFFHDATEDFRASVELLRLQRDPEDLGSVLCRLSPGAALQGALEERLADWRLLLSTLESQGLGPYLQVDLGIVRGLAYYTGFVFEVFALDVTGHPTGRALAGGGRFDHLVGLLGYSEVPAVGFGMGDVVLGDTLEEKGLLPPLVEAPDCFFVFGGESAQAAAMAEAAALRCLGYRVAYALRETGFGKQFKLAGQSGARFALIIGSEELQSGTIRIRDLQSGEEQNLSRAEYRCSLPRLFSEGLVDEPPDCGDKDPGDRP